MPSKKSAPHPQKREGDIVQLTEEGKVISVIVTDAGVTPPSIKLKSGEAINFANATRQDLELKVTGKLDTLIRISAGKSQVSPIFTDAGTSKFEDLKNKKITGEIVVKESTSQSAAPSTPIKEQKITTVTINDKGFTPSRVTINADTLIAFDNKSGKDFYFLKTDTMPPMPSVILSDTKAAIEFKKGQYKLVNKNNASQTLDIVINK